MELRGLGAAVAAYARHHRQHFRTRGHGHRLVLPDEDGRPGGGLGWARLANGMFVNPSDGGCDGSPAAIEKWKGWLAKGITSSADAAKGK